MFVRDNIVRCIRATSTGKLTNGNTYRVEGTSGRGYGGETLIRVWDNYGNIEEFYANRFVLISGEAHVQAG